MTPQTILYDLLLDRGERLFVRFYAWMNEFEVSERERDVLEGWKDVWEGERDVLEREKDVWTRGAKRDQKKESVVKVEEGMTGLGRKACQT